MFYQQFSQMRYGCGGSGNKPAGEIWMHVEGEAAKGAYSVSGKGLMLSWGQKWNIQNSPPMLQYGAYDILVQDTPVLISTRFVQF